MNHEHTGIGKYFCYICRDNVWGQSGRPYIDVIHVYKDRGMMYCATSTGRPEDWPHDSSNAEFPISAVPGAEKLPAGRQEPWPRFWMPKGKWMRIGEVE